MARAASRNRRRIRARHPPLPAHGVRSVFRAPAWADAIYPGIFRTVSQRRPANDPSRGATATRTTPSSCTSRGPTAPTNLAAAMIRCGRVQQRFLRGRPGRHHRQAGLPPGPGANAILHDTGVSRGKQPQVRHRRLSQHRSGISAPTRRLSVSRERGGEARHPRDS